jgi:ABC-type amino acid transport substrate-binding protein
MTTCRFHSLFPRVAWAALLLALACWTTGCTTENTSDQPAPLPPAELPDLGGRTVTVALLADYPPYSQIDSTTGAVQGFDYDFLTAVAARLDFVPRFVAAEQDALLADVAAGRYDLAGSGISFTLQRAAELDFAAPYKLEKERLAVRAAERRIATIPAFHDAAALRAGATAGTTSCDLAVAFLGKARVTAFVNFEAAMDALAAGSVDGVVLEDTELLQEQEQRPGVFAALPGPIGGTVTAYALPRGSELTAPLNAAFEQLLIEGEVSALREKWGL